MVRILVMVGEKKQRDDLIYQLSLIPAPVLVIAVLESVEEAVSWFAANPPPDLILMDLQLRDGNAIQVFARVRITVPIVLLIGAEKAQAICSDQLVISYLDKPVKTKDLGHAIGKYMQLTLHFMGRFNLIQAVDHRQEQPQR